MKATTGTVVDPDSPSLEESATKLQQACEEMSRTMADLSESMSEVADGFALVSASTDTGQRPSAAFQIDVTATRDSGFTTADE